MKQNVEEEAPDVPLSDFPPTKKQREKIPLLPVE